MVITQYNDTTILYQLQSSHGRELIDLTTFLIFYNKLCPVYASMYWSSHVGNYLRFNVLYKYLFSEDLPTWWFSCGQIWGYGRLIYLSKPMAGDYWFVGKNCREARDMFYCWKIKWYGFLWKKWHFYVSVYWKRRWVITLMLVAFSLWNIIGICIKKKIDVQNVGKMSSLIQTCNFFLDSTQILFWKYPLSYWLKNKLSYKICFSDVWIP